MFQIIINGIIAGAIYALIASGFSLIYNLHKFIHIAHGGVYAFSAFVAWFLVAQVGLWIPLAFAATLVIAMFLGILIDRIVYKPLREKGNDQLTLLIASFGVFIFLESLVLLVFGSDIKNFGLPVSKGFEAFGAIITPIQVVILVTSIIIFILLQVFLKKTKTGKALRAASDNKDIASSIGIDVDKLTILAFAIGSALAATAGIMVGMEYNLVHNMGFMAIIQGATASIIGGIGNVAAAVFGGFLLGLAENVGTWFLPSGMRDAISFVILIIFLLFKPQGFFGMRRRGEK
jgi:branched-subunit amino acid ABC-type transport system permease component